MDSLRLMALADLAARAFESLIPESRHQVAIHVAIPLWVTIPGKSKSDFAVCVGMISLLSGMSR